MYGGTSGICVVFHAGRESLPHHCLEGLRINIGGMVDPLLLPDGLSRSILQSVLFRALDQNEQATELQTNIVHVPKPEHKCAHKGACMLLPLNNFPHQKEAFACEENQAESNYIPYYIVLMDVAYLAIHVKGFLKLRKLLSQSCCHHT